MYMCAASKRVTLLKISRAAKHSLGCQDGDVRICNSFSPAGKKCFIIHNFDDGNATSGEGMEASLVYTHP